MAGVYNGHILEFPQIRVDCFTASPSPPWWLPDPDDPSKPRRPAPNAQLYLLTHVHSDHLIGLSNDFTGRIVCSPDTKRMLLKLEAEQPRQHLAEGLRETRQCKYEGLRAQTFDKGKKTERIVDRIEAIPYGDPREFQLGFEGERAIMVTITLLDANHCPGSTMFLVQSKDRAILHTGDVRADALFIQTLRRQPSVQEFIMPWEGGSGQLEDIRSRKGGRRSLDRIYLDTSAMMGTCDMPDREPVLQDLLQQMSLYPPDTTFFLNVWCFGWEDVVKEVARFFDEPVHIDRYKRNIYTAVTSDPYLLACTTLDPFATRFHACDRRSKCPECRRFNKQGQPVYNLDKRIVHVNMVEIKTAAWAIQQEAFLGQLGRAAIGEGDWPFNIDCPIARHSTLPELQNLVRLLRPRSISPNCVMPHLRGLDYYCMSGFFQDCMSAAGSKQLAAECHQWIENRYGSSSLTLLQRIQEQGMGLLEVIAQDPNHDDRTERIPDSTAFQHELEKKPQVMSQKMIYGRAAHVADQISRIGGLPSMGMGRIISALAGPSRSTDYLSELIPTGVRDSAIEPSGQRPPGSSNTRYARYRGRDDDYDTDEESSRRSRRRRLRSASIGECKPDIKPELPTGEGVKINSSTSSGSGLSGPPLPFACDKSRDSPLNEASVRVKEETKPSLRGRFGVDKDRLRALALADPAARVKLEQAQDMSIA